MLKVKRMSITLAAISGASESLPEVRHVRLSALN
jgi:hypothetical protein